ncbi:hypothetical protein [Mesoterricola sediminis]|uniref:Uncharacterized protein n=1 Tax=Mesoterricola sediminis TaxID=2927980 RepID=A0AA48H7E4_9BACT|nr:hypothetical protein [Mesoterricola sediminis]BDU78721.1 hypothetical protein METESE_36790 [Mesoterricola sediminis]
MKLGTAVWREGRVERRALVAPLPEGGRVVDLNRLEHLRLAKLGEGRPETLAEALVPASLRRVLEGGPRALNRARQALAYALKWEARTGLPIELAPPVETVTFLACLPDPVSIRRWDGTRLDPATLGGPGAVLGHAPAPTLAWVGLPGGACAGCCLAVDDGRGPVLGAWLDLDLTWEGSLVVTAAGRTRRVPLDTWRELSPVEPLAAEIILAPTPAFPFAHLEPGAEVAILGPGERLELRLDAHPVHPRVQ